MSPERLEEWLSDWHMKVSRDEAGDITGVQWFGGRAPVFRREVIAGLAALPKLQKLDLQMTHLRDKHFAGVTGFTELKELRLRNTRVSGRALLAFRNARKLELLDVSNTRAISKWLRAIPADSLKTLHVYGPFVGDDTVQTVTRFRNLRELILGSPHATAESILALQELKGLKNLSLDSPVSWAVYDELWKRLPPTLGNAGTMTPRNIKADRKRLKQQWKAWGL